MASAATPATTADVPPANGSSRSAQAAHLSKDKCIAEHASGRPLNLQGSKTLDFGEDAPDELRDLEHDSGLHVFSAGYDVYALPKHHMPRRGMPAAVAAQGITDLRQLDHNPRLNMASFVTTWMEPEAAALMQDCLNVNIVDMDEYPSTTDIHNRCVSMLAQLYHCPTPQDKAVGSGTVGSSEAIMLAGLAMKKKWQARRRAAGLPTDKPNMVMSYAVQVCWEKFCRYWDVEEAYVPVEEGRYGITPQLARQKIDENTIGVVGILGSTYNGEFEDIQGLNDMLDEVNKEHPDWQVPLHVDAASGGFIAPFSYPDLAWDFRLQWVKSINVSGHKYGLVYPGMGWVLWREPSDVPDDLVFHLNYLGSDQASITLNFSRGAANVVGQYYQLLRLGRDGYTKVMSNLATIARRLADGILETGEFELLSKPHGVPLVAFRLKQKKDEDGDDIERGYDEYDVSDRLKEHGWVLPAYTMAPNARHVKLLRAVIRVDHSMTLIEKLVGHIRQALEVLRLHEASSEASILAKMRKHMQPHRHGSSPNLQVKTTSQC
ncbi:pyridoxal phosphate-dependent transferase [Scenedesmus sp. NREL 46B-D3]|nr:pyridoxal phosphate-dependent transferase [Scenedesmus sp. NREL 46B-D3]